MKSKLHFSSAFFIYCADNDTCYINQGDDTQLIWLIKLQNKVLKVTLVKNKQ